MKIKGFIKNSFLDWDGKIASIIFTGGCNFRCPFCHNKNLVEGFEKVENIDEDFVFDYLLKNKKWIDGVVITGGEPTLQADLLDFMQKLKTFDKSFLIKLDTNGYNPEVLEKAIDLKLVDYVAMDIKTALNQKRYSQAVGLENFDFKNIERSLNLLLSVKVSCEFRTTLCPSFVVLEDLLNIAEKLKDKKTVCWAWQNFRHSENILDEKMNLVVPYTVKKIDEFEKVVKGKFGDMEIRLR